VKTAVPGKTGSGKKLGESPLSGEEIEIEMKRSPSKKTMEVDMS